MLKTGLVAILLGIIFLLMPVSNCLQIAEAQNPIVDVAAEGIKIAGGGATNLINMIIGTVANAGGLLAAVLAIGLSMLNGLITFIMSMLAGGVVGIIAAFLTSSVLAIIVMVLNLIITFIVAAILPILGYINGIIVFLLGIIPVSISNLILVIVFVGSFIIWAILTIWISLGMILQMIWGVVMLILGGIGGIIGIIAAIIPILALFVNIATGVLFAIWIVVSIIIYLLGEGLPLGIMAFLFGVEGSILSIATFYFEPRLSIVPLFMILLQAILPIIDYITLHWNLFFWCMATMVGIIAPTAAQGLIPFISNFLAGWGGQILAWLGSTIFGAAIIAYTIIELILHILFSIVTLIMFIIQAIFYFGDAIWAYIQNGILGLAIRALLL